MGDLAHSIQQTKEGGYIIAGETRYPVPAGNEVYDIFVLKLNPNGTIDWQKSYGGDGGDSAYSIQQTKDGGYIVAGRTGSFGTSYDAWVLKLRPYGTVEWQKTYGGADWDVANSIQETRDGGYIVAGETESFAAGELDVWVLKLRANGIVEWQKVYGGGSYDVATSIQQTADGGYVVAGHTYSFGVGGGDAWVLKLRPDGTVEWEKTYGGVHHDTADAIQQTTDGGYIVAGFTESFGAGADEKPDAWLLKLRTDGSVEWQKAYGGGNFDRANSIQQTTDGGYIVAGFTESFSAKVIGSPDAWVLKLKADGTVEWQKTYGSHNNVDEAQAIRQTNDGGYIVVGETWSFGYSNNIWVLNLNTDGSIDPSCDFTCNTSISGINSDATILDTSGAVRDSDASPKNSLATIRDANASVNILCGSSTGGENR